MIDLKKILNEENIFSRVSEYELFEFYFMPGFKIGYTYQAPYRSDSNPSFNIFSASKGTNTLLWKDFGMGKSGNIFAFIILMVEAQTGDVISYFEALIKVNRDFDLKLNEDYMQAYDDEFGTKVTGSRTNEIARYRYDKQSSEKPVKKSKKELVPITSKWNNYYFDYWTRYEKLTIKRLEYYNIYPCIKVLLNNNIIWTYQTYNPIYGYSFYDYRYNDTLKYKTYRPLEKNKRYKWLSSTHSGIIEGLEQFLTLGEVDLLIITKSLKDVVILSLFDIPAIAPSSEGVKFTETFMAFLRGRAKRILLFYDNDEAGHRNSKVMSDLYGLKRIWIPDQYLAKDPSDFLEKYGYDRTIPLLQDLTRDGLSI